MKTLIKQLLIICLFSFIQTVNAAPATDIDIIKKRVIESIMHSSVDDARIETLISTLNPDGTWPGINYEDVSNEGFEHRNHLSNMLYLARAYKTKSSKFHKSKKAKNAIELALKNWTDHDYFCDNWWHNQIGTPGSLVALMLVIGDELQPELVEKAQPIIGRANIYATGARPGGDRIKIAGIEARNMLFTNNNEKFEQLIRVIEGEITFVHWIGMDYGYSYSITESGLGSTGYGGRGIQYDNSFHHRWDGVNNTLSYGTGYAEAFIEWAEYALGTKYAFSVEKINQLIDYYIDGICKHMVFGKYPDMGAKNRSVSRPGYCRPDGPSAPLSLLKTTDYRKNELQEIADVRQNKGKTTLSYATFFWNTEHFTVQRPGWYTSVRMYSTRNYNMEVPYNSEGLLNHHRGDGTNHISRTGDEYYDISPVLDYQKIPGTTVMQKRTLPSPDEIQKLGLTDFVGAVTDGKFGAAAFDFKSPHDPLVARKAWFFFKDEYVCLGAGISCRTNLPVATTLNQCLLRGDVSIYSGNEKSVLSKGEKEYKEVDWVFHDGIGYVFPQPVNANLKNDNASGSWWDINKQSNSSKKEVNLDVFKLWLDHGQRPSNNSYEYMVVPATTIEKLESGTSKKNVEILSNTPEIQAVKSSALNIAQLVFYKAGEIQLMENLKLISHDPGILMIKMNDQGISEISVADPNRELGRIHFSVSAKIEKPGDNFSSVWNEKTSMTDVFIDLPSGDYAGKSVTVKLK